MVKLQCDRFTTVAKMMSLYPLFFLFLHKHSLALMQALAHETITIESTCLNPNHFIDNVTCLVCHFNIIKFFVLY